MTCGLLVRRKVGRAPRGIGRLWVRIMSIEVWAPVDIMSKERVVMHRVSEYLAPVGTRKPSASRKVSYFFGLISCGVNVAGSPSAG